MRTPTQSLFHAADTNPETLLAASKQTLLRVGFVMSTEVGLNTQYQNWRNHLTPDLGITPEWIVTNWWKPNGFIESLPFIPSGLKARLRAFLDVSASLSKGPFDALFVCSEEILYRPERVLARQPYVMVRDVTRRQLYQFGDLYHKNPPRFAGMERREFRKHCRLWRGAVALFPWSHWAASSLIEDYGADPARIHVVPPGVDLSAWQSVRSDERQQPTNILFVGGNFHRKGGYLLLEWAAKTHLRDWTLHLVTRDNVTPPNERVKVYNNLSSNAPALIQLYQNADIFVLPTLGDCYSLASIEAMAAGLPVIVTDIGGIGDIVQTGKTGYLMPPGDEAALAERLEYLIGHPDERLAMGREARRDAEERYDVNKNIIRTVTILRAALGVPLI